MPRVVNINTSAGATDYIHLADSSKPQLVQLDLDPGSSVVIVGANGSGKTRLGTFIEFALGHEAHRIPAQRSIAMMDQVTLADYETSISQLLTGYGLPGYNKRDHRWGSKPEVAAINDFEHVMRALFAQKNRALSDDHEKRKAGQQPELVVTKLDRLYEIWQSLLPKRSLIFRDASISVKPPQSPPEYGQIQPNYSPSDMSDGERVVFYLIGQCLLAPQDGVVIIDEPELHIHHSISSALWDALERERNDCAFVYITHDIDFATNRVSAKKFFVRAIHFNSLYDVEPIPENTGLPEELVLELVGNRKPILFIEGEAGSLDSLVYRSAYPDMKIEPRGSCDSVIHSVASFKANSTLHRLGRVVGCVDADHRSARQIAVLNGADIYPLGVAEIENLFLLPKVFVALARALSYSERDALQKLEAVRARVLARAREEIEAVTARFAAREIDRRLKRVTVDRVDTASLIASYAVEVGDIDVSLIVKEFRARFKAAIDSGSLESVLEFFDQKGLLAIVATELEQKSGKALVTLASRLLLDAKHQPLKDEILSVLPKFSRRDE